MVDLEAKDAELRARLNTNVTELVHNETAEAIDDELLQRGGYNTPAVFTLLERVEGKPKAIGGKPQIQTLRLTVGIVTQSVQSRAAALKGAKGSYKVRENVAKAIHWWFQTGMLRPWKFIGEESVGRAGGRLLYQQIFENSIEENFS